MKEREWVPLMRHVKPEALSRFRDRHGDVIGPIAMYGASSCRRRLTPIDPRNLDAAGERRYSDRFNVGISPDLHRELTIRATNHHVSLNRFVSDRLARD
jgi:predicted HicB family RNase H-like nuclease